MHRMPVLTEWAMHPCVEPDAELNNNLKRLPTQLAAQFSQVGKSVPLKKARRLAFHILCIRVELLFLPFILPIGGKVYLKGVFADDL